MSPEYHNTAVEYQPPFRELQDVGISDTTKMPLDT